MLLRNDLIRIQGEGARLIRVLWLHPAAPTAFVIDVEAPKALPEPMQLAELLARLEAGEAVLERDDPFVTVINAESIPESRSRLRDMAWLFIEPLVASVPEIFFANRRFRLIEERRQLLPATRKGVYTWLRRYWQRGQTPNALLPDYHNSGGKGKSRLMGSTLVDPNKPPAKRGRPRKFGDLHGLNVDERILKIFMLCVDRCYASNAKFTFRGAYDKMIKDFFSDRRLDLETGRVHFGPGEHAATGYPTLAQFTYWYRKHRDELAVTRRRLTPRIYDKDMRGLLGTSTSGAWGPGARFQIDATIADVYLVSRYHRDQIVGRPVLYVVIDVFSRMIVGIYVGLEGPSWVGAMMALANTAGNKVDFCAQHGITITEEEWPCRHLPAILLGDRGEIESRMIETLQNNFHVAVENAAAYRADWKGIVEQRFRLLPAKFKPYVPGYIEPDFRERGARDYRVEAVLDLHGFTQIIILCALYYNNHQELTGYDKDREVAADRVLPVPIELWEWGIANRSGSLRRFPEDLVRFSLLPTDQAVVTENGIRYAGCFYSCAKAIEERWFDRARQRGTWPVPVSYDPRDMDVLYLHDKDSLQGYCACLLTERSRADIGMSMWEIGQRQQQEKHQLANHKHERQAATSSLIDAVEQVVAEAMSMKPQSGASQAEQTRSIRDNRAREKALNRESEKFRLAGAMPVAAKGPGAVIPFPGQEEDDYALPTITEILGSFEEGGADDNE